MQKVKHTMDRKNNLNLTEIAPMNFMESSVYHPEESPGKRFMRQYPDYATYDPNYSDDSPLGPLSSLDKSINLVNPFANMILLLRNIKDSLLKGGHPLRERKNSIRNQIHGIYSKIPPPWL